MSELIITNNNIGKLNNISLEAKTLIYRRESQSYNTAMVIQSLLNYKNILQKLENVYIHISCANEWIHDMKMFECLYFLIDDDQIKNMVISNGKYNIKKENNNFILEAPYAKYVCIPQNVNEITFFYDNIEPYTTSFLIFSTIFNNFPSTLKKINFRICNNDVINHNKIKIKIFDNKQKILLELKSI